MQKRLPFVSSFDAYDAMCFFGGLVFFAPVALLVRTQAGVTETRFFLLQALLSAIIVVGEIPTGRLTDKIGYRAALVLSQSLLLAARILLTLAYITHALPLFVLEAVIEGISACFASGTDSAYLSAHAGVEEYLAKTTHAANCGTAGFLVSTVSYAAIYHFAGITGLLFCTIVSGAAALVSTLFLPKIARTEKSGSDTAHPWRKLFSLWRDRRTVLYTVLLSLFSVAWLLVNFFYAEKAEDCGIPLGWLAAIIIGYSLCQMLAEPIVRLLRRWRYPGRLATTICCLLCGAAFLLFGNLRSPWMILPLMLCLPLVLELSSCYVEDGQNRLVDEWQIEEDRATALSTMNIGVNLVEFVSLFASSAIAGLGIHWCFAICGLLLILGGLAYGLLTKDE